MNVNLPFSKTKRYLTGMDWVILTLDYMSKKATGVGNVSQIVLELAGFLPAENLRAAVAQFVRFFPILSGYPTRDITIAPYWKIARDSSLPSPRIQARAIPEAGTTPTVVAELAEGVNQPFQNRREHLAFHLFHAGTTRSYVAMTFDHRLFDAHGAELFLWLFQEWQATGRTPPLEAIALTEPAHLDHWKRRFDAGKIVSRQHLVPLSRARPAIFPRPAPLRRRAFQFQLVTLGEEQSRRLIERAYAEAGYLMLMPYLLGLTVRTFHERFSQRRLP